MRENAEAKARRYLIEGRMQVAHVSESGAIVYARGDGTRHRVTHSPAFGWACTCPARGRCCHLLAAGLVLAVDGPTS